MTDKYKTHLELFSVQLAIAIEELQLDKTIYSKMADKDVVIMYHGYVPDSEWQRWTIRVMGAVVKGAHIGFLYDALSSVCKRTKYRDFRIMKRHGQFIHVELKQPYTTGGK